MNKAIEMRNAKAGERLVQNLQKRFFDAYYCATKEEALAKAMSLIPAEHTVSWGGCQSAIDIGLIDSVKKTNKVIDRDSAKTPQERVQLMKQALTADTFLMGTNAISLDGQLVNIDGAGNRLAALCYGPDSVIVICGINKLCRTLDDAYTRARTVAGPVNMQRFGEKDTPCSKLGICGDCKSADCICSQIITTRMCKPRGRIKVIVVGEELGF